MQDALEAIAAHYGWSADALAETLAGISRLGGRGDSAASTAQDTFGLTLDSVFADTAVRRDAARATTPETPSLPAVRDRDRFIDLGPLGVGGMGEVRRVLDRELNRTMAMKIIKRSQLKRPQALARFVEEAQCSAQLQHPGIVPVHELGSLPDGRVYFTMREVRGRTLAEVIVEVHAARTTRWETSASGWSFRRLIGAFLRVCEAVAFAHSRGVIHRDLKPQNIMLGAHGEVLVLDWGLARILGSDGRPPAPEDELVTTDRSADESMRTRVGQVAGTPAYMPPEQARGDVDQIGTVSDVYALGAVLHHILRGRPPYQGGGLGALELVLAGPPEPLDASRLDVPEELVQLCRRAMARDPAERFAETITLAEEVRAWLDGVRRRDLALEHVRTARALAPEADAARARAVELRREAEALLEGVPRWASEEAKAEGWRRLDEATALERQAELQELRLERGLYAALRIEPELAEAHEALAQRLRVAHAAAEQARDLDTVERTRLALEEHANALPLGHPVRERCLAYLRGDGALTLVTDPPGAEVLLHRYELRNRRRVPVLVRSLGSTPLRDVPLPMGSYLCVLRHPERAEVSYPVHIARQHHWDGVRPGGAEPRPVYLPTADELGPRDHYVPAGWFQSGGDPVAGHGLEARRLWCDGLVVQRFQVTNADYLVFLDDLVRQGRQDEALRLAPRERGGAQGDEGALIFGFDGSRFFLQADAEGDVWDPDAPVLMVHYGCAVAYARWWAERTGQPWRLPGEHEWEKAGRGVDGRFFPWGDLYDPSWACNNDSHEGAPLPHVVDSFPVDESVYGVRGLGGNARDWCAELRAPEGAPVRNGRVIAPELPEVVDMTPGARRVSRGGYWTSVSRNARCANRSADAPTNRLADIGIRLARSLG